MTDQRQGYIYGLLAYGLWGLVPLYFSQVRVVPTRELLTHRIVWCAAFLAILVTLWRRWPAVARTFRSPRLFGLFTLSAGLIAFNWWMYIHAVETEQIVQASLGYFITPLLSVLIGRVVLGERMRPLQWTALAIAAVGCALLVWIGGEVPTLALSLAVSFSLYGLVRKKSREVDALLALTVETLLMMPFALALLGVWGWEGALKAGTLGTRVDVFIVLSGVVTALPLLAFGQATRHLPLSSLGFLQFSSPTIQFLIAVLVLGEAFDADRALSFAVIWIGVALFIVDLWRFHRPSRELPADLDTAVEAELPMEPE